MDNWDSIRDQISNNMQLKSTEELRSILKENDREEWSDTAFEVVKEILIKRTGEVPQIPIQRDELPGEHWKSVDWKKVYERSQEQVIAQRNYGVGVILIFVLMLLFASSRINLSTEWGILVFFILLLVFLGWALWYVIRQQKANRLFLEAQIYLKYDKGFQRGGRYLVEIAIRKAFVITPEGEVLDAKNWRGHRKVSLSTKLYNSTEEQDTVNLLCLSNGSVLGKVEEYIDS
jgi:hypothetical protein